MSAITDKYYIDLSPDKCISIQSRHILLRHKRDDSYYQGRPINEIESKMTDEIVSLRADVARLTQERDAAQARIAELEGYIDAYNERVLQQSINNQFLFGDLR